MVDLSNGGERLIPGQFGRTAIEHLHRYALAVNLVKGKNVLDIACGEGYGSFLLSKFATHVTGIDISNEVIQHAINEYKKSNIEFITGSACEIPVLDKSFDVIVSFETIEHLLDHEKMISEMFRVLKDDGVILISTPEKSMYSEKVNFSNKFHLKELYLDDFKNILQSRFKFVDVYFQKYFCGSIFISEKVEDNYFKFISGDFNEINFEIKQIDPDYIIVLASKSISLPNLDPSIFTNINFPKKENYTVNKIGFRYRLIDKIFFPFDFVKRRLNR